MSGCGRRGSPGGTLARVTAPASHFSHPFRAYTPAAYTFPLPEGHRFPAYKYAGVRDRLTGLLPVLDTPALRWADLEVPVAIK